MLESNAPLCFWDDCIERRARINNLTDKNAFRLHGSTPHPLATGDKETFQICANIHGMNGVTSKIEQQLFPATRMFWAEYLAQQEEQPIKWPNGYSRQMVELYQEDL